MFIVATQGTRAALDILVFSAISVVLMGYYIWLDRAITHCQLGNYLRCPIPNDVESTICGVKRSSGWIYLSCIGNIPYNFHSL
jgi:hypothetical protein